MGGWSTLTNSWYGGWGWGANFPLEPVRPRPEISWLPAQAGDWGTFDNITDSATLCNSGGGIEMKNVMQENQIFRCVGLLVVQMACALITVILTC